MLLMVYSLWAIVAAISFLAHATEAGMYYMVAGALLCISVLMALTPTWAPLEVAFFMSLNLTLQGLYLRRTTDPNSKTESRLRVAAATTIRATKT
jgi:membrane protein implicated in regulation of membrane protease activity